MMRTPIALLLVLAAVAALPAGAAASDRSQAQAGARWLLGAIPSTSGDGQAADAVVAARAAGVLPARERILRARALRRGVGRYATTAGATAKVVLGLQAATGNGRCAGRTDLVRRLSRFGRNGRYGSTIFDQSLAFLALRATGNRPSARAIRVLKRMRGKGGWSFSSGRADDVTSTGIAIQALRAAGVRRSDGTLRAGLRWMRAQRTRAGGFALGRRDRNEANSTAIALVAQRTMGVRDARAARVLRGLQRDGGAFQFTATDSGSRVIASTDAVLALSGRTLPVNPRRSPLRGC